MANTASKAILRAYINSVLTDLMVKTTGEQVYLDDTTTVAAKISEMVTAINARAKTTDVVGSVTAGDKSVTVGGTSTAPTVAVKLSAASGNALSLETDGLKATVPTASAYTIAKDASSTDYAAVYHLTKDGVNTGVAINIPKDMVVQSGEVVTNPTGQAAGTYIKLVLQNVTDPLYINVGSLIEYVTSGSANGDMIVVAVSDDHKVTATITDGTITLSKLASAVQTKVNQAHAHDNKSLLDSYTQTETNLADAVSKKHSHSNKTLLDSYTQTETNLADAVSKKHSHSNASVLDGITSDNVSAWSAKAKIYVTADQPTGLSANDLWVQIIE